MVGLSGLIGSSCSGVPDDGSQPSSSTTTQEQPNGGGGSDTSSVDVGAGQESGTPGVSDHTILFGQSAAFSGPAQELGQNMRLGIQVAFQEINELGGVHGRTLELVSLDDTYEPELAITNTIQLIEEEEVFALIGEVGTPTSRSATPIAAKHDVPFLAPFTGAAFLRDDEWDNIVNLRSSYAQETEEMVERLTTDLGIDRIAIVYQDDSFGRTGYRGVIEALDRRNMTPVSIGLYPRNTVAVKTGLLDIQVGRPEAVIIVGAYEPVAALISWARHTGFDPVFFTISFVGSNALAQELGPYGEGVYVTQVVPFPTDQSIPIISSYLSALETYSSTVEPGFVSLEGYIAGRLAIFGLERCGKALNRKCFLDALLQAGNVTLDGFSLSFGEGDNQGSDRVFLTVIGSDGQYQQTERLLEG